MGYRFNIGKTFLTYSKREMKLSKRHFSLLRRIYCEQTYLAIYRSFNVNRIGVQVFRFLFRNQQRTGEKRQTDNTRDLEPYALWGEEKIQKHKANRGITRVHVNIDRWPGHTRLTRPFSYLYLRRIVIQTSGFHKGCDFAFKVLLFPKSLVSLGRP